MNYQRNWNLIERYGITQVDYDEMLAKQDGGCAACRSTVPGSGKGPYLMERS